MCCISETLELGHPGLIRTKWYIVASVRVKALDRVVDYLENQLLVPHHCKIS